MIVMIQLFLFIILSSSQTPNPSPDPSPFPSPSSPSPDLTPQPIPSPNPNPLPVPVLPPNPVPNPNPDPTPQPIPNPNPIPVPVLPPNPNPSPTPNPIPSPNPNPLPVPVLPPSPNPAPLPSPSPSTPGCSSIGWNYQNPNVDWPSLPCLQTCSGNTQSPVNINSYKSDPSLGPLTLTGYGASDNFGLTNKGYTIEVEAPEDYNSFFLPGYNLVQFHFHNLAENIFSTYKPLTMHMVHRNPNITPGFAVLTFLWDAVGSTDNAWIAPIINNLSLIPNATNSIKISMGGFSTVFQSLQLNGQDGYVNFLGSLTTPPCTEGVQWYIALTPLTISEKQWKTLFKLMNFNYRPIQRNLTNVSAYIPQLNPSPNPSQNPSPNPSQNPTPPTTPPALNIVVVEDATFKDGFLVLLVILIILVICFLVAVRYFRKKAVAAVQRIN